MEHKIYETELAGRKLSFEFGRYAEQAAGSVLVRYGDTVVLVCATVADTPRPGIDFFPLSVDYEEEYSKYLMQEVSFEPRDNDDFMALLRLLERWHKKSIPQILEKNRPDAAYAIAMALCKHIPLLINRDDIQELVGEYKRRIGKLIFDSYQALVEAVKIWNHEEKRQEVCRYIKETAGQYPNHRGMKKKLMDLMPETPFDGEPMAVTREPNDMEKSLL